jgi:hypothetical protein
MPAASQFMTTASDLRMLTHLAAVRQAHADAFLT